MTNDDRAHEAIEKRIDELSKKSSQTLLFLSFALVVVATLKGKSDPCHEMGLRAAMRCWSWALLPVVAGILPVKEFGWSKPAWYRVIRWVKVVLLWIAVILIAYGVLDFTKAVQ